MAAARAADRSLPGEVSGQRTGADGNPAGAVTRERPGAGLHGQAQCAADQDAVDSGQRLGDGQEVIPRRAGRSRLSGGGRRGV